MPSVKTPVVACIITDSNIACTCNRRHADVGSDLEAVTERLNKIQLRLEALTDTGRKADLDAAAVGIKGFYQVLEESAIRTAPSM